MTTDLTTTQPNQIATFSPQAVKYAAASKSANTRRSYKTGWEVFKGWAIEQGRDYLPASPETVCEFATDLADSAKKPSTIAARLAAISEAHQTAGAADPTKTKPVKLVMAGIRRQLGTAPAKKSPVSLSDLESIVKALPDTLAGERDKAVILLGWAGAFRRSELVSLDVADLRFNGVLKVAVRKSKTDQEGHGAQKTIPYLDNKTLCPVLALQAWLDAAKLQSGPVFRKIDRWGNVMGKPLGAQAVAFIVKDAAKLAGLDWRSFAGHSLRSGFITEAAQAGVTDRDIAEQTQHKSMAVLHSYMQLAGEGAQRAVKKAFSNGGGEY